MRARLLVILLLAALAGCTSPPPQQPGGLRLTRTSFADLPDWNGIAAGAALASFQRSCAVLMARPDAAPMGGAGYAGTVGDWRAVCADALSYANKGDAKAFFEKDFMPFAVGGGAPQNIGLFTGYYEPEIRASRTRHGAYQTPVYGPPPDLVRADLGLFDPKLKGEHISGKVVGHALLPTGRPSTRRVLTPPSCSTPTM
jgi:membrane-bound lytic murein transglycosylase A